MGFLKKLKKVIKKVDPIGSKLMKADPLTKKLMGSDKKKSSTASPSAISSAQPKAMAAASERPMSKVDGASAMTTARNRAGARSGVGRLQKLKKF